MEFKFNNDQGLFEAITASGDVIATSANLQYLKQKVRLMNLDQPVKALPSAAPSSHVAKKQLFTVEERFQFIQRFTTGVVNRSYLSLVLVGDPGLGKTHTVLETLKQCGLREIMPLDVAPAHEGESGEDIFDQLFQTEGDYVVIKGFSTPKAMYRTLWENNGKIIVFDDADGAFKQPDAANILKGALDTSDRRVISWGSERRGADDDLPSRFVFDGRVIFISNLAMKDFPAAILSRAVHVDLSLTVEEKVDRIAQIFSSMHRENPKHLNDVLSLVREHAGDFKELSVRTATMLLSIRKAESDDRLFERMALYHAMT